MVLSIASEFYSDIGSVEKEPALAAIHTCNLLPLRYLNTASFTATYKENAKKVKKVAF